MNRNNKAKGIARPKNITQETGQNSIKKHNKAKCVPLKCIQYLYILFGWCEIPFDKIFWVVMELVLMPLLII